MPCALSETGPKVSIATMTPTVVSRPVPARATANSDSVTDPPPTGRPRTPRHRSAARRVDGGFQTQRDAGGMTVAGPVRALLATSSTGLRLVSVKYPVSCWMAAASTMPMMTAPMARIRGLNELMSPTMPRPSTATPFEGGELGRQEDEGRDRDQDGRDDGGDEEATVDRRHPGTIAGARRTAKMPMTAVMTPIAGTTSRNTRPRLPKAAVP